MRIRPHMPKVPRRDFLAGALAAALTGRASAAAPRVVSLDYAVASTMIALGAPPVAVPSTPDWDKWVVEPALPEGTVNLGSMREVNLEVIERLAPDMIFSSPYLDALRPTLERIAPVESFPVHNTGAPPYPQIVAATRAIGRLLGRADAAEALIAQTKQAFAREAGRCGSLRATPLFFVSFMDPHHVRVYGRNGIFQEVMDRMALINAWKGRTNGWGFATVGVEELAGVDSSRLFYLDPVPPDVLVSLARSPLWRQMPFVRQGRIDLFPTVLMFGALPAMARFARLLGDFGERDAG